MAAILSRNLESDIESVSPRLVQLTATRAHLRQLFWARNAVLAALLAFIVASDARGAGVLVTSWVAGLFVLAVLVNTLTGWRLLQRDPVSYGEFLLQILADVAIIGAALQHSGGSESPLSDLNFIPLVVAAATLPGWMTMTVFAAVFGLHELVCHFLPGAVWADPADRRLDLLVGGILTVFVYCMAHGSRAHEALVALAKEQFMRQRHAADLGTLAASIAHQLGSPLATMAIAVGELRAALGEGGRHRYALDLLESQILSCKEISSRALASTGHERAERGGKVAADLFLARIVEKCALMQPWMAVECQHEGPRPVPEILADASLEDALTVLLLGFPGSQRRVRIMHRWDQARLMLHICDDGPLPAREHPDQLMARSTIGRFGGTVGNVAEPDGRSCLELSLPLDRLTV